MRYFKILFLSLIAISILIFAGCTTGPFANQNPNTNKFQLSTSITPGSSGTVNPSSGMYSPGANIALVATPANYYKFIGWAGDISGSTNPITIKMDSNKNVIAAFTKIQYNLQINVDGKDGGTIDPPNGNYDAGSQIKITASPAKYFRFDHWGGGATGNTNPLNIVMDNNKSIVAYFIKQYTLNISANPSGAGSVSPGTGVYDANTRVQLSASQTFPYIFSNWVGTDNDTANPTNVTMTSDKSISCNFIKVSPSPWKEVKGVVARGGSTSVPIELNQNDYVEGEIVQSTFTVFIQDPTGKTIKDFGYVQQANFLITAQVSGRYNIILQKGGDTIGASGDFVIRYRTYSK